MSSSNQWNQAVTSSTSPASEVGDVEGWNGSNFPTAHACEETDWWFVRGQTVNSSIPFL